MFRDISPSRFRVTARYAITNAILVINAFVWYYLAFDILLELSGTGVMGYFTTLVLWIAHFASLIFSAIVGALLANWIKERTRFLTVWMVLGVASSAVSIIVDTTYVPNILLLSLLFGVSLGLGMPSCMGYFTESIETERRGSMGGIILLISGIAWAAVGAGTGGNIGLQVIVLTAWRMFGLISFLLVKPLEKNRERSKAPSYRSLFNQRSFVLYLIPWLMFSLVTYLTVPIQSDIVGKSTVEFLAIIENVFIGAFAVIGGFLSDLAGRKRIAIIGFIMLGLGYSALGIQPEALFSWYFYTVADGAAWGMLFVIFVITVWGDLSYGAPSDRHYAIGVSPFFISKFLQLVLGNYIVETISSPYAIFSFTALFLFLAVLPLMYAPETLPEKNIRERELKSYIEKAKKAKEKHA
jgi:MFS family permease